MTQINSIGTRIEEAGWRQGSIVSSHDIPLLLDAAGIPLSEDLILLVASQSCDVAHSNLDAEPFIELSVGRRLEKTKSDLTNNKNPRILHTHISLRTGELDVIKEIPIEIKAYEKIPVPKNIFVDLSPSQDQTLEDAQIASYVAWLAARYSRPALPTTFNELISKADPKGKIRTKIKRANNALSGIYVQITPNKELTEDETYSVNLLGLLPAGYTGAQEEAQVAIKAYETALQAAGMEVYSALRTEDQISLAQIRNFSRFYFDDLSYKDGAPLPPESTVIL